MNIEPSSYFEGLRLKLPDPGDNALQASVDLIKSDPTVKGLSIMGNQSSLNQLGSIPSEVLAQIACMELNFCGMYTDFRPLARLRNLKILVANDFPLKAPIDFDWFPVLEQFCGDPTEAQLLNLGLSSVVEIRAIAETRQHIVDFNSLPLPAGLKKLQLSSYNIASFNGISKLEQLEHLTCIKIRGKKDYANISNCFQLKELVFMNMGSLQSVQFPTPPNLLSLNTYGSKLDALTFVEKMPRLVKLVVPTLTTNVGVSDVKKRQWEQLYLPKKLLKS